MKKSASQLQYLQELEFYGELRKIDNAEKYYKNHTFYNSLAIMLFIMSLIMIVTACVHQFLLININETLISLFITILIISSFVCLIISTFYNSKTMNLVKQYYNKY